jgi:hypothetical protein
VRIQTATQGPSSQRPHSDVLMRERDSDRPRETVALNEQDRKESELLARVIKGNG